MPEVAYVMKAFPRLSETFIASEILRVEQAGQPVRLFVMKPVEPWERVGSYPVVERIRARPVFLPQTDSLSQSTLGGWLRRNLPAYLPALQRVAARRPGRTARIAAAAAAQMARELPRASERLPDVYVKELLQAIALADELMRCPDVGHLHAHFAHGATTVTWWASMITGLPFSFTAHARDIWSPAINPGDLLARKKKKARFVITCTEANRRHLLSLAPEAQVHRVYHGLNDDVARELAAAAPRRPRNGRLRVLGVGRLVRKKGFDVLVDACFELERRGVPFDALIVGPDGGEGDALRARIGERGLDGRVTLTDFRPEDLSRNRCPVPFMPDAQCPRFTNEFLRPALPPDDIDLVQRWCGHVLAGINPAQRFVILDGPAATGKPLVVELSKKFSEGRGNRAKSPSDRQRRVCQCKGV